MSNLAVPKLLREVSFPAPPQDAVKLYSWITLRKKGYIAFKLSISTYPVQPMISGPSKEKGSESSGSDLILYTFVNTSFVK